MTARERKASGGTCLTAAPSAASAPHHAGRNGVDAAPRLLGWEEWFQNASAAQRAEMLALAARQGLLYADQLPPPAHGGKNKPPPDEPVHLQALTRLLTGQVDDLPPVAVGPLTFIDQQLDAAQRAAVGRALFTPDVFLLQGLPGTGRSRVLAEILLQAAARGDRVLFLADHPAALDAVLPRLATSTDVLPIRFLDPVESPAALGEHILPFTLPHRQRILKEEALANAGRARAEAERQVARRQQEESCWAPLRELVDQSARATGRLVELAERVSQLESEVESAAAGASPFAARIAQLEPEHSAAVDAVNKEFRDLEQQGAGAAAQLADARQQAATLRPLAEAKRRGRWWAPAWWRATIRGRVAIDMAALESRCLDLEAKQLALEQTRHDNRQKCQLVEDQYQADRARLLAAEVDRLRQEIARAQQQAESTVSELTRQWQAHLETLASPADRPTDMTDAAVAAAAARWENQRQLDKEAHEFACRWADYVATAGEQIAARLPACANVLAGTMAALTHDLNFAAAVATPCDLLILENAEQFTEADILRAARHARRWVLVAETHGPLETPPAASVNGTHAAAGATAPRPGCFQKLWQGLHCDSRRLRYAWSWEEGRPCCTLKPVSGSDRAHLEVERVADYPEIELRILALPKAPPVLAQVVFPADMAIHDAKRFIYRELEEVAVHGTGRGAWLSEDADAYVLHLAPVPFEGATSLELDNGLREWVAPATARTCRLEFARADWPRPRVNEWLRRHLELGDSGRTMVLQVPYRMSAGLARPLGDILLGGAYVCVSVQPDHGIMEFVAVPPLAHHGKTDDKRRQRPSTNGVAALPREGAGLEVDLAAPRGADRMPADVRAELPRRGFANYLEAQAVIRKLEELTEAGQADNEPVAVIALYEGQVALLRCLAERSEILRRRPKCMTIGSPAAFAQLEYATVLVSLTRSHSHRPVALGERANDLVLALTRARERLILFGDPGTLVKRGHWRGLLDHQDAGAAALEARRVAALVHWLSHDCPPASSPINSCAAYL